MNINTEQVFLVNSELEQGSLHTDAPLQRIFAMSVDAVHPEGSQSSSVCHQSLEPPSRSQVCRLCATDTELVVPIFEGEGLQNGLADKINQHLPIRVSEKDTLPVVLCFQCTSTVLAWHELVLCCVQADQAMRERFLHSQQPQQLPVQSSQTAVKHEKRHSEWNESQHHTADSYDHEWPAAGDPDSDDSEDKPLASIKADRQLDFLKFYEALKRFRDHMATEHAPVKAEESLSGEESDKEEVNGERSVDAYDDLSGRNLRRSRLDAETRAEIARARERTDDGRVVYRCLECGKALSAAHTLLFHRRIHSGERPCVCHVCGAQFRTPAGLQRHLAETHERRRRPACRLCRRTFANAQNLKQHLRTHTGERPYECHQCGKRFAQSGTLHAHRATHEQIRPHVCTHCGAAFRLRAGLARHALRHSGERPYACDTCSRTFRTRHEAAAHKLTHIDAHPHACDQCPAAFRLRRALRHHYRRLHAGDTPLPPPPVLHTPLENIVPPYPESHAQVYVRCEHCPAQLPYPCLQAHILSAHAHLLFLCAECNLYRHRTDMMAHMNTHIQQKQIKQLPDTNINFKPAPKLNIPVVKLHRLPKLASPIPRLAAESTTMTSINKPSVTETVTSNLTPLTPVAKLQRSAVACVKMLDLNIKEADSNISDSNVSPSQPQSEEPDVNEIEINDFKAENKSSEQQRTELSRAPAEEDNLARANEFSDHSDTENEFGKLPESVFDAIEDSQDTHYGNEIPKSPETDKLSKSSKIDTSMPRACPVCQKQCNSLSGWYYHMKRAHNTSKTHICDACNKVFKTKRELQTHTRTHTKEKPFVCRFCEGVFSSRAGRYIHEQTHGTERSHVCDRCPSAFRWKAQLRRHLARHDSDKKHVCFQCGRGFSVAFDLLRHVKSHTPGCYKCELCTATFKQKRYLKVHMGNMHAGKTSKNDG